MSHFSEHFLYVTYSLQALSLSIEENYRRKMSFNLAISSLIFLSTIFAYC
jgi:hypothetical protein